MKRAMSNYNSQRGMIIKASSIPINRDKFWQLKNKI